VISVGRSRCSRHGLTFGDLQKLALRFRGFDAGGSSSRPSPVSDVNGFRKRQSVVLLDEAKGRELFEQIRQDVPPGTPDDAVKSAQPAVPLIVRPEAVRARIYNGAGIQGLGRRAADDLERVGFQVVGSPGNREGAAVETSCCTARARRTPPARWRPRSRGPSARQADLGNVLEVVVGSSYAGAQQVTVTGAPKPRTPGAQASPPPVQTAAQDPCAA
jgi:hypothetical protein